MKRRSFIQGVLALLGATVAAKALPTPEPRMLTDEFPNGLTARYYGGDGTGKLYYIGGEPATVTVPAMEIPSSFEMMGGYAHGERFYISTPVRFE